VGKHTGRYQDGRKHGKLSQYFDILCSFKSRRIRPYHKRHTVRVEGWLQKKGKEVVTLGQLQRATTAAEKLAKKKFDP